LKHNSRCIVVIPARLSSTRLERKPLVDIAGKTLIRRVYENAAAIKEAGNIVVATDSQDILNEVESFGGRCVMTPAGLNSGSDRVFWAVEKYFPEAEIIVNLQGDEPFIDTDFIDTLIEMSGIGTAGLYSGYSIISAKEASSPSVVKVVVNSCSEAVYFSRAMIPYGAEEYKKHMGIYVWKRDMLEKFSLSSPTRLERTERLEQLRLIESGHTIMMVKSSRDSLGIDLPEDVDKAVEMIDGS